jgi:hypothetical protein
LLEWLTDIDRADKLVPDLVVYAFSILSFAFLPAHFGRKVWLLVGWFLVLNLAFLNGIWDVLDWQGPNFFVACGQLPWILFVADLLFKGRLADKVAAIPMRELILWQTTRLMGLHFILAIYGGYAPISPIVPAAAGTIPWCSFGTPMGSLRSFPPNTRSSCPIRACRFPGIPAKSSNTSFPTRRTGPIASGFPLLSGSTRLFSTRCTATASEPGPYEITDEGA